MNAVQPDELDQAALWNGPSGQAWIDGQVLLDGMFRDFERILVDEVAAQDARRVLDVGCGTGATTLAIAKRIGPGGRSVGVDISAPMIAVARARAAKERSTAEFVVADAGSDDLGAAGFDLLVSRFGVMFFEDPQRAFMRLRRHVRAGGAMRCIAWRHAAENPFMTTAERAAAPLLPSMPVRKAEGPGQFAFADSHQVSRLLEAAGWRDVELRPLDIECRFPETALVPYLTRLGPVGMALRDADEATRQRLVGTLRAAFDPYVRGDEVRFIAACWMLVATTS
jgi:ubiquinone/menaquinone biosynthesis C-methylase UbiE